MGFLPAIKTFYKRYSDFNGRSSRSEYWWFQLLNVIIIAACTVVAGMLGFDFEKGGSKDFLPYLPFIILALYLLIHFIGLIGLSVRRFHDLDQSGWLVLAFFVAGMVPLIGILASIGQMIWFATPGTTSPNKYGDDPVPAQIG